MLNKYIMIILILTVSMISLQNCTTKSTQKTDIEISNTTNTNDYNKLNEKFQKTGWITAEKYRTVVFIITGDECTNSSLAEIEVKIKFEAFKHLQKELSPTFNRNAGTLIRNLVDNSGKLIKPDKGCSESNTFFYDIEKSDLKSDFEKIKNLK